MMKTRYRQLSFLAVLFILYTAICHFMPEAHFPSTLNSLRYGIWAGFVFLLLNLLMMERIKHNLLRLSLSFALACTVLALTFTLPAYLRQSLPNAAPQADKLRILSMNINVSLSRTESDIAHKLSTIDAVQADLVVILESTPLFQRSTAEKLKQNYPHQHTVMGLNAHPTTVLSKFPLSYIHTLDNTSVQYTVNTPQLGDITLIAAHPIPPITPSMHRHRNISLKNMALLHENTPLIIAGDFNTVYWDPAFKGLLNAKNLKTTDAPVGTWLSAIPAVPLDYILVPNHYDVINKGFVIVDKSDHFAIWADVAPHS